MVADVRVINIQRIIKKLCSAAEIRIIADQSFRRMAAVEKRNGRIRVQEVIAITCSDRRHMSAMRTIYCGVGNIETRRFGIDRSVSFDKMKIVMLLIDAIIADGDANAL